ncbi:uncharacterized protein LOC134728313 [Mytilus trossulus]|uniref:uncharacterized protein LOC134728313 n=1 Tax=Mytilus trossulus TaxID=6551 RepID=UPI003005DBEB
MNPDRKVKHDCLNFWSRRFLKIIAYLVFFITILQFEFIGVKGSSKGKSRKDKLPQMSEIELMDGIEPLPEQTEVEVGNKDDFSDASPTRPRMSSYEQMRMDSIEKNRKFLSGLAFHHIPQESCTSEYIVQGIWVIVAFEQTWYPGLVKHIDKEKDSITITFMHPSGKNKFKWPVKEDRIDVERKFVIFVCLPPCACPEGENMYVLPGTDYIKNIYIAFQNKYFTQ